MYSLMVKHIRYYYSTVNNDTLLYFTLPLFRLYMLMCASLSGHVHRNIATS